MVLVVVEAEIIAPEVVLVVVILVAGLETEVAAEMVLLDKQIAVVALEHLAIPAVIVVPAARELL
jgi:hypothetical protein